MAKSLRSKAKLAARRKKRDDSHYAVADAARLQRVSDRLTKGKGKGKEEAGEGVEGGVEASGAVEEDGMAIEETEETAADAEPKKISTSGSRDTRREQWRLAKGMSARPKSKGLNRQGTAQAKRKAGRPTRRR